MRAHAWQLWAAINRTATGVTRVWETWPRSDTVLGIPDRVLRPIKTVRDGDTILAEQLPVMADVAFDPIAAAFIRTRDLFARSELVRLRADARAVPEFPRGAIAIKPVWYPIAARGLTAMPIWDGEASLPDEQGNADLTWQRVIAVDPTREAIPPGETAEVTFAGSRVSAHVVPLAAFEHHALSAAEARAAQRATGLASIRAGDSIALVAMHVTTKEIPDWVWATFWWHDRAGPFAADRPSELGAAGNYLMDVAFSTDQPCFNPWLEARFHGGLHSNCVTCHQRAAFGVDEFLPVTRGHLADDDPYFTGRLTTDFVWTLAIEAR
jgi:hypothetical protein